jgi:hypothetical protein
MQWAYSVTLKRGLLFRFPSGSEKRSCGTRRGIWERRLGKGGRLRPARVLSAC